jgi:DHA1 family tetracycline resistance protein-like MFS transporter
MLANRALVPLLLVNLIAALGFSIILPLTPYYAAQFGAGPLTVGLLTAAYAVCAFVAGPIFGQLSDRQGRRRWLLISQAGTVVGFVVFALGGSLWVLFLGRIIDGISGGNQVIAQAYVGDVARPEERARAYGLLGASFGLGAIAGPLMGGFLSGYGYAAPAWAAAGLSLVALLVTARWLPETVRPEHGPVRGGLLADLRALGTTVRQPALRPLFVVQAGVSLASFLFISTITLLVQLQLNAPPSQAGIAMAFWGVTSILLQGLLVGRLVRRFGEARLIPAGLLALAAGTALLFVAYDLPTTLGATALFALGGALAQPSLASLLSRAAGAEQGGVMGATQSLQSLAQIVAPVLSGWLIARFSPGAPGLLAAAVALVSLAAFRAVRPDRRAPDPTPLPLQPELDAG